MEEIKLFHDNKYTIYYLSLFDNYFKDENYFKIGTYKLIDKDLKINYDNGIDENYNYLKFNNNIKYYSKVYNENKNDENIKIVHNDWQDELILDKDTCSRKNNNDKGTYILNENKIIIKWENYNEEIFIYDEEMKYFKFENLNNFNNHILEELNNTIIIKNHSWENKIILDYQNNICERMNENRDKGYFKIIGNYLEIDWFEWDNEIFYKENDFYYNNEKYIEQIKFFDSDKFTYYEKDKEYIYLNEKKYKYSYIDKILILNNENDIIKYVYLDNEYYNINYNFNIYQINDENYMLFKLDNIILNNKGIIYGNYNLKNNDIILIEWYDKSQKNYKLQDKKLLQLEALKLKDIKVEDYYIIDDLLFDSDFKNSLNFQFLNNNEIFIEKSLKYVKDGDIFYLNKDNLKNEIILYDNEFEKFYSLNHYLINSNNKFVCLIDDKLENIHIKKKEIMIYKKIFNNIYVNKDIYFKINLKDFDDEIYNYFENNLLVDNNLLENINNTIIYNNETFLNNYIFIEKLNFNIKKDIFQIYGYFIVKEYNINNIILNELIILNFKNNKEFIENQNEWINYLINNNKNIILIFDDFSYYEFANEIFNFEDNFFNYVIIINYIKFDKLIHFYINRLINHFYKNSKVEKINYFISFNDKIKQIKNQKNIKYNDELSDLISGKLEFIIFVIYFYIKNKNLFDLDYNFSMNINEYNKLKF